MAAPTPSTPASSVPSDQKSILVVNSGSSTLKCSVYAFHDGDEHLLLNGIAESLGTADGRFRLKDGSGKTLVDEKTSFASGKEALDAFEDKFGEMGGLHFVAVGHRVVHGGPKLRKHQRITPELLETLEKAIHFAPLHIPAAIAIIRETETLYPGLPQFACFDTAFHRTLPEAASHFPLPEEFWNDGIFRYGFHGLSYESIVSLLGDELWPRTVVAHLGNGCSLAALHDGVSVDTSMGLTPTGGIPMSTRSGDLDPGVVLYLLRTRNLNADSLDELLNHQSGLFGLSGGQSDLRALQASAGGGDAKAAFAIEVFCRSIRKTIASYAAVLGGLDTLVFTGGIGENSAVVRAKAVEGLSFMGIEIDDAANQQNRRSISKPGSPCQVRVIPTDEDLQIARHAHALLAG